MKSNYKLLLCLALLVFISLSLSAQGRVDIGVDVPLSFGISLPDGDQSFDIISQITLLFPEIGLHYLFDIGPMKLGLGIRMFTFIIESLVWPNIFAEFELSNIVLQAQLGGGAFLLFGILNSMDSTVMVMGDLSIAYKFNDIFRAGIGILGIGESSEAITLSEQGVVPYVVYVFGKFNINF